jgi:hypothetical protein
MKEEKAARTREEINRKISELRSDWDILGTRLKAKSWHEDENWPTLLKEMPAGLVRYVPEEKIWDACNDYSLQYEDLDETGTAEAKSPGEAVALAWLKWKESDNG